MKTLIAIQLLIVLSLASAQEQPKKENRFAYPPQLPVRFANVGTYDPFAEADKAEAVESVVTHTHDSNVLGMLGFLAFVVLFVVVILLCQTHDLYQKNEAINAEMAQLRKKEISNATTQR